MLINQLNHTNNLANKLYISKIHIQEIVTVSIQPGLSLSYYNTISAGKNSSLAQLRHSNKKSNLDLSIIATLDILTKLELKAKAKP